MCMGEDGNLHYRMLEPIYHTLFTYIIILHSKDKNPEHLWGVIIYGYIRNMTDFPKWHSYSAIYQLVM